MENGNVLQHDFGHFSPELFFLYNIFEDFYSTPAAWSYRLLPIPKHCYKGLVFCIFFVFFYRLGVRKH